MPKGYPKAKEAVPAAFRRVAKGGDAYVTVKIESSEGATERSFLVSGFTQNTLAWQRQGPALDEMLTKALSQLGPVSLVK